ncbi:MarR family winged helix-turn-helix transcriptional regulator [Variovorax saccharolyticus]|uniref:MarR family winged helix-turn-helix transcriptional regulator n=1 Tax=Variovorax saccharolyticus TaxID=3053516 RepID=UPI002577FC7F|nr:MULTISPECIES: MarR family winged helix-turn-helix transcriptional regulator [unclassified Variovorax]MDM0021683.1 MarR family winged helix-turn-helix transcriptional regulator [Variovorax sp. J22R187]MDM0028062.1 MarR family winged helix-turn-helix transcriptional regulator [Variovorax sp. J31P216]
MTISKFQLLQHLPHLLRRAHFEADALFPSIYGDGLTSRQLALLVAVAQRPGGSQSQVAQDIGLDLNTCSDLVQRTASKGLLKRERSSVDGRSFCLFLTDDGERALVDSTGKAVEYRDAVARRLSASEREQLIGLLRKMLGFDR